MAFNKIFKQLCSLRSRAVVIDKFRIPRNPVKHEIFHDKRAETLTVTGFFFSKLMQTLLQLCFGGQLTTDLLPTA